MDGFVLSDYGQGTLTRRIAEAVMRLAEGRYVGLDSRHRLLDYPGISAATRVARADASGVAYCSW